MKKIFLGLFFYLFSLEIAQGTPSSDCPVYTEQNFTLLELTQIIRNKNCSVKTIDDVLALLPERMRSKPVLFYRSLSLQSPHRVDYLNPRAILSSVKDSFMNEKLEPAMILIFNGHPSQAGYNSLETVNLIPNSTSNDVFNFHEINFPDEKKVQSMTWSEAQLQIKISPANPAKCIQCHGQPARPIFQQYPNWDGAFGNRHTADLSTQDALGFNNFIQTNSKAV